MKLGFIGTGNMASAIMGGIISNNVIPADEIIGADLFAPGRERVQKQFGIHVTDSNIEVAQKAEVIILSVKPQFYADVIKEIAGEIKDSQIIITIAPGKTLAWLEEQFGKQVKIVRTMPNTPAMVGAGMTAASPNAYLSEEEISYVKTLLESFSRVEIIPERLMDVVVSTSGSSPAYVFMMIEAMADAAVSGGMPRPQAYQFAAQAVLGSAKMVLDTGKHPEILQADMPRFILQPLVENAILHSGLSQGRIWIEVELLASGKISILIKNDGQPIDPERIREVLIQKNDISRNGIGLQYVARMLENRFGDQFVLRAERTEDGINVVEIRIPFEARQISQGDLGSKGMNV